MYVGVCPKCSTKHCADLVGKAGVFIPPPTIEICCAVCFPVVPVVIVYKN